MSEEAKTNIWLIVISALLSAVGVLMVLIYAGLSSEIERVKQAQAVHEKYVQTLLTASENQTAEELRQLRADVNLRLDRIYDKLDAYQMGQLR